MLTDGLNISNEMLLEVLTNKVAQGAIREAQLEAGVQMLTRELQAAHAKMAEMVDVPVPVTSDELPEVQIHQHRAEITQ